eukprot:jgi/Psemu1/312015/fgenesh1_kg.868_\
MKRDETRQATRSEEEKEAGKEGRIKNHKSELESWQSRGFCSTLTVPCAKNSKQQQCLPTVAIIWMQTVRPRGPANLTSSNTVPVVSYCMSN